MQSRTCRLCHSPSDLQISHLIPKSTYKQLDRSRSSNPHPVWITADRSWVSSKQIADQLLCAECEQRFHRNGEAWVLKNGFRQPDRFELLEMLATLQPLNLPIRGVKVVQARQNPAIRIDHLTYFAASIIWRAAAHRWSIDGHVLKALDIRTDHMEQLAAFLLSRTPFPPEAHLWVTVSSTLRDAERRLACLPHGGYSDGHYSFRFSVPGIHFSLFFGRFSPTLAHELCVHCTPEGFIHLDSALEEANVQRVAPLLRTSKIAPSLAKAMR